MIVCAAIVGQQNNPLYLRTFPPVEEDSYLKFHYIVHCALDAVEEKVLLKRSPGEVLDAYLGLLYPTEEYKVFGYVTNTHVKFILIADDTTAKDEQVLKVFKRLHSIYVDAASDPFHTFGLPIKSIKFEQQVEQTISSYTRPGTSLGAGGGFHSYKSEF